MVYYHHILFVHFQTKTRASGSSPTPLIDIPSFLFFFSRKDLFIYFFFFRNFLNEFSWFIHQSDTSCWWLIAFVFSVSYDGGFGSRTRSAMMTMWLLLISMAAVIGSSGAAGTRTTFAGNRLPDIVPGVPGVDYPVASRVPATLRFRCDQQDYPGFFADPETGCQVISPSISLVL